MEATILRVKYNLSKPRFIGEIASCFTCELDAQEKSLDHPFLFWKRGEIAFDVEYQNGSEIWTERLPILDLCDMSDLTFAHQDISIQINNWITTAKKTPNIRRNCLICNTRASKGSVLCLHIDCLFYKDLIYA